MIDALSTALTNALTEVDLAICDTYRGQGELRQRLENIQTLIATLPQVEKSELNPKQIQGLVFKYHEIQNPRSHSNNHLY